MDIRREAHALLETVGVARDQLEGGWWGNSLLVTGLSKHVWGVPFHACSARCPARSALDKIGRIYADIPPHTGHTYGAGAAAGLEHVLARGWFREHCWIDADSIFETCGYSEGRSTTKLTAKRVGRFVARSVFPTNKTRSIAFAARRY